MTAKVIGTGRISILRITPITSPWGMVAVNMLAEYKGLVRLNSSLARLELAAVRASLGGYCEQETV
jgi:hypothetical protein